MSAIPNGPCENWEPIWLCDLEGASPEVTGHAVAIATEILWALSGRQFGTCDLTIRPCRPECFGGAWPLGWYQWDGQFVSPRWYNGIWTNITCGGCSMNSCSCTELSEINLPAPVVSVNTVKVDGITLGPSDYRVDNWRKLVRLNGLRWPECNNLNLADTEDGTWSVQLTVGQTVPESGKAAVGEFACELVKLFTGAECMLPKPVQQLVRQGITMTFLDPNEAFDDGRIGLYLTDMFIKAYNPNKLAVRSTVYDIDSPGYRIAGT